MATPKFKILRNILLVFLVLLVGAGIYLYFALQDTSDIQYPTSRSDFYVAPEVAPQTRDDFSVLFFSQDDPIAKALEAINIPAALRSRDNTTESFTEEEIAAIESAWESFAPVLPTFERLLENPPFPLAYEEYSSPVPSLHRFRNLCFLHILQARILLDQGEDPRPLLNRAITFIDLYYRSSSSTIDFMVSQVGYRFLLENFSDEYLAQLPRAREALQFWKSTWRKKLDVALKLEFFLLYNELGEIEAAPSKVIFGDASNALGPFFMNFLFKPNQTFNDYWNYMVRMGEAVQEDDTGKLDTIEAEIMKLSEEKDWTNLLGDMLLSMSLINVREIYEKGLEMEEEINPILDS